MAGAAQNESALKLGIQLAPAKEITGAGDQGVAIVSVDPDGVAASKGVAAGDVILDVSGKTVSQPSEVKAEIAAAKQRRQEGGDDEGQDRTGRSLRRVRIPEGVTARPARRER